MGRSRQPLGPAEKHHPQEGPRWDLAVLTTPSLHPQSPLPALSFSHRSFLHSGAHTGIPMGPLEPHSVTKPHPPHDDSVCVNVASP